MSKLAQIYANTVGVKLPENPPEFPTSYFPVPKRYITLHAGASEKSRVYDYYNIVVMLLTPTLQKHNIEVVNIGVKDDPNIYGTLDFRGKTSIRQAAYVIENSMLHFGSDSCWSHMAGIKKVPFVGVYSVNPSYCAAPFYVGKHEFIDAPLVSKRPFFDQPESVKSINLIKPEVIAHSILQLLGLHDEINMETLRLGGDFNKHQIDFIPNSQIDPKAFEGQRIAIRMDLNYDVNAMGSCLMFYDCMIVSNRPISIQILNKFKNRVKLIVLVVDSSITAEYVDQLHKLGIEYHLITEETGQALSDLKLKLFDYNQIFTKKKIDAIEFKDSYFMTNRRFLSRNKIYPSVAHFKLGIETVEEPMPVRGFEDNQDFLESIENCLIIKEKNIWKK